MNKPSDQDNEMPLEEANKVASPNTTQRRKSVALAFVLAALVVLFYAITIIKMGPDILKRPL